MTSPPSCDDKTGRGDVLPIDEGIGGLPGGWRLAAGGWRPER